MTWKYLSVTREVSDALKYVLPNGRPDRVKVAFRNKTIHAANGVAKAIYKLTPEEFDRAVDFGYKIKPCIVSKEVGTALDRLFIKYSKSEIIEQIYNGLHDEDLKILEDIPTLTLIEYIMDGYRIDFKMK